MNLKWASGRVLDGIVECGDSDKPAGAGEKGCG